MRESPADRPRSAAPSDPTAAPRSRREARELTNAARRRDRSRAPRHAARTPACGSLALAASTLVTAAVATAGVVGLPASVSAGTPTGQQSMSARASTWTPGAAAADLAREGAPASRSAVSRATLAQGVGVAIAGKQAMTTRLEALTTSLTAGVEATEGARERVREVALSRAFHEPVVGAHRTSSFGWRWGRMHNGIDFGADYGAPLYAVGLGTVTTAGWNSGLGYHVKVTLDTDETVVYGHLSRIRVSTGDRVAAGHHLGDVGSSGRSTGAHLHLEVRTQDGPIDPEPWLAARRG